MGSAYYVPVAHQSSDYIERTELDPDPQLSTDTALWINPEAQKNSDTSVFREIIRVVLELPRPVLFFACVSVFLGVLCLFFNKAVLGFLNSLATHIKNLGVWGYLLCFFAAIVTSFPFTVGYSIVLVLCGLSFGFPLGFIPGYLGTVIGASLAFIFCRIYFKDHVVLWLSKTMPIAATKEILAENPLQSLLFLRLAPIPFSMINCFCAGLDLPLRYFILATSIVQCKIILHIYAGHSLAVLAASRSAGNSSFIFHHIIDFILSISLLVTFMILSSYMYLKYQRRLNLTPVIQNETIPLSPLSEGLKEAV